MAEAQARGKNDEVEASATGHSAYQVLSHVRPLYQACERAVDHALQGTDLTVPLRAVLELLLDRGVMTVPQVAREFAVTRQSVQTLVDTGVARGLVELRPNPHHRRSRYVAATEHGTQTFNEVHRREVAALARVTADLDATELAQCARVLVILTDRIRRLYDQDQEPT